MASIHTFDPDAGCDATTFQPCSDKALANHRAVVDSFRVYPLNRDAPVGTAIAVGRYAEDVYYGGNPWYLATLAAAEQLYDALYVWKRTGSITVTPTSLDFFRDLAPWVDLGDYFDTDPDFIVLCDAVFRYADGFLNVVEKYVGPEGSMAEQFDKSNGQPRSARDLTWSYAAFLTAAARREGAVPPSWGLATGKPAPSVCIATSVAGSYSLASATEFPSPQGPISKTSTATSTATPKPSPTSSGGCTTATSVVVTFDELAVTRYGDTIKLLGNVDALGNWDPNAAVSLDASGYKTGHPLWRTRVELTAGQVIQYKYINVGQDGTIRWEADPNHTYAVPATCATAITRTDKWRRSGYEVLR